jgi:hypothetical protein
MEFLPSRCLAIDLVEEADEFLMPVASHALPDDTIVPLCIGIKNEILSLNTWSRECTFEHWRCVK